MPASEAHSWPARTTTRPTRAQSAGRSSQKSAPSNAAINAAAVRRRVTNKRSDVGCRRERQLAGRLAQLLARAPETALARAVGTDRRIERGGVEIGPQRVGEIKLGVGQLPEQEVADALLAAGADEQIGLRRVAH